MLGCCDTVTVVHHKADPEKDRYDCTVICGVSWFGKRGILPSAGGGLAPRDSFTVRIPAENAPNELPQVGDTVVRGILAEYTGKQCLEGRESFQISFVGDNRRSTGRHAILPHVVLKNT